MGFCIAMDQVNDNNTNKDHSDQPLWPSGIMPLPGIIQRQQVSEESIHEYVRFREAMLRQLATTKGRRPSSSNSHVLEDIGETSEQQPLNFQDRRKKNNEAAKRSRDTRRAKEDEIAIRAAFLEQENIQLKWEAARLKSETARLRTILLADCLDYEININK